MGAFGDYAKRYWDAGLSPLPIRPGEKRPYLKEWEQYCSTQVPENERHEWLSKFKDCGIGLALGIDVMGFQLVAFDIDDEEFIGAVSNAIGVGGPAKKGKKGITFFALADKEMKNTKIKAVVNGKKARVPAVEFLAHGSQTVIPPTIHPDGMEYHWVGPALLDVSSKSLPIVSDGTIDEIMAIVTGKGQTLLDLHDMVWRGVDGGGNTHDCCVAAVACMVARNWSDADIHSRIERAKLEACLRAGEEYSWPQSSRVIQEWIDSAREKGMTGRATNKKLPPERVMMNWALEELGGEDKVVCWRGQLRAYADGYWPEVSIAKLSKQMYLVNDMLKEREAKAALNILHTMTQTDCFGYSPGYEDNPRDDELRHRVCLMNGTFNMRTGILEKHEIEHQLMHRLTFSWDDNAACPTYERVLDETFAGDKEAEMLWDEFCAHTLVDDMSFQKMLFLKGPGGNGKGTLARVLRSMHDPMAVGSVAITDLNDERKRTSLVGKLVNISGEQSRLNLVSDTYLKKITGGDPIDVRKLYGETQNNVKLSVRFVELVNEMPATSDNSDALRRRIMILNTPNKVKNPDPSLDYKLFQERPGILKRWVAALHRLYERGQFIIPQQSLDNVEEYLTSNDPVKLWVQEKCDPIPEGEIGSDSSDLYVSYSEWATAMGFRPQFILDHIRWGAKMKSLGYPSVPRKIHGVSVRVRQVKLKEGHRI